MRKHPPKDQVFKLRMTKGEREMLRTLAVRSSQGSDSGYLRWLIRRAWESRTVRELLRDAKERT